MAHETDQLDFKFSFALSKPAAIVIPIIINPPEPTRVMVSTRLIGIGKDRITFPGGQIEDGETALEAAVREFFEETGQEVDPEFLIETVDSPMTVAVYGHLRELTIFFCFADEAFVQQPVNIESNKHSDWTWIGIPNLISSVAQGLVHPAIAYSDWLTELPEAEWIASHPHDNEIVYFDEVAYYANLLRQESDIWPMIPRDITVELYRRGIVR